MDDPRNGLVGTLALLAATVALLFAVALGADEDGGAAAVSDVPPTVEPVAELDPEALLELGVERTPVVARRIEEIRTLEFDEVPEPQISDVARLRRIAERELSKPKVQDDLEAADAELKLLGLLEPTDSLAEVSTDVTASAAAYYDPRRAGNLYLVGDSVPAGPALTEFVLAHELNHALEDQVYTLPRSDGLSDDRVLAESALVEGSATALMTEYAQQHLDQLDLVAESSALDSGSGDLPRFAEAEAMFTYLGGQRFVDELMRIGGGWKLVDFAYERRLPATTEQILHPEKYLEDEGALPISPPPAPGPGWRPVDSGTLGEFATREILREDATDIGADAAAAGWGGDSYRLFVSGADTECVEACRQSHSLGIAWRGDDASEAAELADALGEYVTRALAGEPGSAGAWQLDGGWAAVSERGDRVGLGLAPTEELARRVAGASDSVPAR